MITYRLEALDSEQRVVGTHAVAFSTLDNVIILRLPSEATQADAELVQRAARKEFPDRRSIVVIKGDVDFLRIVPIDDAQSVSTEGAAWAMEQTPQCTCRDVPTHDKNCPAGIEAWRRIRETTS